MKINEQTASTDQTIATGGQEDGLCHRCQRSFNTGQVIIRITDPADSEMPQPFHEHCQPNVNHQRHLAWGRTLIMLEDDLPQFNPHGRDASAAGAGPINKERADAADDVVGAWNLRRGCTGDPETDYQDLISDICHAIHRTGQDPREAVRMALDNWWTEAK